MRIFYASDSTPNAALASNLWRNNLYLPLVDLGNDVVEFDYNLRETFQNLDSADPAQRAFIARNRPKVSAELLRQIELAHHKQPLDLFFSYFYDACVTTETIDQIRAMGIRTVNWYCNGSYQLHLVEIISPHYDWCLVPEKFRLDDYRALGAHPIYCQEAANPTIYKPYELPQEFDVTFVGQAYGERPTYISNLIAQGLNVRVWGFGWEKLAPQSNAGSRGLVARARRVAPQLLTRAGWRKLRWIFRHKIAAKLLKRSTAATHMEPSIALPPHSVGGPLSDTDLVKMYSRSKINLGFSSVGETHRSGQRIVQVRLRDFEVPMSGGFYMVEYMEELEEFFKIGEEIVCYTGEEDLAEKIRYYLTHDEERERIRQAGHERCLRDHSWHKRFEMAFREMGLS